MLFAKLAVMIGLVINPMTVMKIIDGDTIDVASSGATIRVRLYGIDAPEKKQEYGQEATNCAKQFLLGQTGLVKTYGSDLYGRALGEVYLNGRNINPSLVSMGCAWATPQYLPMSRLQDYVKPQIAAKANRIGLWAKPNPVEPSAWRKQNKIKS